jgi:hypothetical protein
MAVTRSVKPQEGRFQTATQVKVLSPVITNVKEADSLHMLEGCKSGIDIARVHFLFRGRSPRYEINREIMGTWEILLLAGDGNCKQSEEERMQR